MFENTKHKEFLQNLFDEPLLEFIREGVLFPEIYQLSIDAGDHYQDSSLEEISRNYQTKSILAFEEKKQVQQFSQDLNNEEITFLEEKAEGSMKDYEVEDNKADEGTDPSITDLSIPLAEKEEISLEAYSKENFNASYYEACNTKNVQTKNMSNVFNSTEYGQLYCEYIMKREELICDKKRLPKIKGCKKRILNWEPEYLRNMMLRKIDSCLDKEDRIDVINSTNARTIRKVPDILLKLVAKPAEYKSTDIEIYPVSYLIAFKEGFTEVFNIHKTNQTTIMFAEFMSLRFPADKVESICNAFFYLNLLTLVQVENILQFMKIRNKHSLEAFAEQYKRNSIIRFLLDYFSKNGSGLKESNLLKMKLFHSKIKKLLAK